jgi:hypothetical protein
MRLYLLPTYAAACPEAAAAAVTSRVYAAAAAPTQVLNTHPMQLQTTRTLQTARLCIKVQVLLHTGQHGAAIAAPLCVDGCVGV